MKLDFNDSLEISKYIEPDKIVFHILDHPINIPKYFITKIGGK